jgi:hypothetical protein
VTAAGLERVNYGMEAPGVPWVVEVRLKPSTTFARLRHRLAVCWADHGLGGRGTDTLTAPAQVGWAPGGPAWIAAVVSQEKGLEAMRGRLESPQGICAGTGAIAAGFVLDLGDRDRWAIARAPQTGPWDGVTTVGVDPIAGLLGDQGGGHDPAEVACVGERTVEPIPTRPRFRAQDQRLAFGRQFPEQRVAIARARADGAEVDDLGVVCCGYVGDSAGLLRDIHADVERARLVHG